MGSCHAEKPARTGASNTHVQLTCEINEARPCDFYPSGSQPAIANQSRFIPLVNLGMIFTGEKVSVQNGGQKRVHTPFTSLNRKVHSDCY